MVNQNLANVKTRLIAAGFDGLYEAVQPLVGFTIVGRFTLRQLFAAGGQSLLWLADDSLQPAVPLLVRMALLPYHRPAYISADDVRLARQRIECEAAYLQRFQPSPLPGYYGLFHDSNPLHPPIRGAEFTENEPYLALELINGISLRFWMTLIDQHSAIRPIYHTACQVAWCFLDLCRLLAAGECLYADVSLRNLLLANTPGRWPIRVVDPGGLILDRPEPGINVPFTADYLQPEYYQAYQRGENPWPTPASILYALGKLLWQIFTGRQPFPGEPPDLRDPGFTRHPILLTGLVTDFLAGKYSAFDELESLLPVLIDEGVRK